MDVCPLLNAILVDIVSLFVNNFLSFGEVHFQHFSITSYTTRCVFRGRSQLQQEY